MNDLIQKVPLGCDAAFPESELKPRVARLQEELGARSLDIYLTTSPENIFYLSGQQTPGYYTLQCLCVPASGAPFLIIRGLESYNARANSHLEDIVGYLDSEPGGEAVARVLQERGWRGKRIAIDKNAWYLTVNLYGRLEAALGPMEDGAGLVEALRVVKSDLELEYLERAHVATDAGMRAGMAAVAAGASENDLAADCMHAMIMNGSEYVGMEPLISSGYRSGLPHATWRRRRIEPGDVVVLENSAAYNRYHSGLFRTVPVAPVPPLVPELYAVALEAFEAGLASMKPGNRCADVHNAVQAVVDGHGCTDRFRKKSGYSLGISFAPDWGEGNILALNHDVDVVLQPGMAFHLPITLRDYAVFTVAVSETIVITEQGSRVLGGLSRALFP